jgi:hypothetical protein
MNECSPSDRQKRARKCGATHQETAAEIMQLATIITGIQKKIGLSDLVRVVEHALSKVTV